MTPEEFEQLVNEGIEAIPKKFLDLLDNVAVTIEDWPRPDQVTKYELYHGRTLYGLYEGVPRTKRGPSYSGVLPDKITIFRGPIEQRARNPEAIKQRVTDTVWHEIALHFGLDQAQISQAERRKRRK